MRRRSRGLWLAITLSLSVGLLGYLPGVASVAAAAATLGSSMVASVTDPGARPPASEAIAVGADGAVRFVRARPYLSLFAAALILAYVFGGRAVRSRSWRELALHLTTAFAGGASAAFVMQRFHGVAGSFMLAAVLLAALLASAPWLLPEDAPRTLALHRVAARTRGPLSRTLCRALVVHRWLAARDLPPRARAQIARAFDALIEQGHDAVEARRPGQVRPEVRRLARELARLRVDLRARGTLSTARLDLAVAACARPPLG